MRDFATEISAVRSRVLLQAKALSSRVTKRKSTSQNVKKHTPVTSEKKRDAPKTAAPKPQIKSANDTINDIFASLKNKKPKQPFQKQQIHKPIEKQQDEDDLSAANNEDGFANIRNEPRSRKIVDGLPVYTEEDLNIGKGGNTPLCPFEFV